MFKANMLQACAHGSLPALSSPTKVVVWLGIDAIDVGLGSRHPGTAIALGDWGSGGWGGVGM